MTPERAQELATACHDESMHEIITNFAHYDPIPPIAKAILAACAEERREALTWAAKICRDWGDTVSANSIEAARDAEGR